MACLRIASYSCMSSARRVCMSRCDGLGCGLTGGRPGTGAVCPVVAGRCWPTAGGCMPGGTIGRMGADGGAGAVTWGAAGRVGAAR
jgi:hypothetical protein